ncbi:hypothetical protein [Alkalinema sp. FACHB-956]|uniref:hypothetical protein n=1 Tax=Alkalinema sp. FACHB-956 TaxID=2692768 RepID=UPI001687581C|nr:hypothetical protein [Alkalinema sp. FACHB-956]MBD2327129.1 hypothetical protein [Alkalinema sp. FACHB-956]
MSPLPINPSWKKAVKKAGREEGRRSLVISLLREGAEIDLIVRATGWSIEQIQQLQQDNAH